MKIPTGAIGGKKFVGDILGNSVIGVGCSGMKTDVENFFSRVVTSSF